MDNTRVAFDTLTKSFTKCPIRSFFARQRPAGAYPQIGLCAIVFLQCITLSPSLRLLGEPHLGLSVTECIVLRRSRGAPPRCSLRHLFHWSFASSMSLPHTRPDQFRPCPFSASALVGKALAARVLEHLHSSVSVKASLASPSQRQMFPGNSSCRTP